MIRIKSSKYLCSQDEKKRSLCARRASHNTKSTNHLFHLPTQSELRYSKNYTTKNKNAGKSKTKFFGNSKRNSGSMTTKNKSKVNIARSVSNIKPKQRVKKKALTGFISSTDFRMKKIANTKQPSKPTDDKPDIMPENEGSSFKNSKASVLKQTPPQSIEMKKPRDRLSQRGLSIQINLISYPNTDTKEPKKLESYDANDWKTEQKKDGYFSKENISNLRKSPPQKQQKSHRKNQNNFKRFDKNCLAEAKHKLEQQKDPEIEEAENKEIIEENIRKQLDFSTNAINKEENMHPNCAPLKTDRTEKESEKRRMTNTIPLGDPNRMEIQNSAPHKKKNDDEWLNTVFSTEEEKMSFEENRGRSISNGKSSQRAGSNNSNGSKIIVKKMDPQGSLLSSTFQLSSQLLSSRLSYNLSASESGGVVETKSQESKEESNPQSVPKVCTENQLQASACTYDLSDSEDEPTLNVSKKNNLERNPSNHLKNYQSEGVSKMNPNNKIFIQNTYMDENRDDEFGDLNIELTNPEKTDHDNY